MLLFFIFYTWEIALYCEHDQRVHQAIEDRWFAIDRVHEARRELEAASKDYYFAPFMQSRAPFMQSQEALIKQKEATSKLCDALDKQDEITKALKAPRHLPRISYGQPEKI